MVPGIIERALKWLSVVAVVALVLAAVVAAIVLAASV